MPSHPAGPGIWLSVWRFLLTHYLYERAAEVLARLRGCAGSPEPSLLACAISTKFAWRGPFLIQGVSGVLFLCCFFFRNSCIQTMVRWHILRHLIRVYIVCLGPIYGCVFVCVLVCIWMYVCEVYLQMSQLMRLWYLSHRWPAKAQVSLRIHAASPESLLFVYM